jgi:hypothetical protein
MTLPTKKSERTLSPDRVKALLYGPPKIGKSTFASQINPDHTLFISTEPGLGSLEVYEAPVTTWAEFREVGADLAKDRKHYEIVVIDTVDELYRMCSDYVCAGLGIKHPSDAEYGKGWAAVADEFRLRVGKIAGLGMGVWFISHAEDREVKKKVGTKTVTQPTLSGQARKFLVGFVDFIFLAEWEGGEEGERRLLRTQGAENHEAGGRVPVDATPLPDPLPLDAAVLRREMAKSLAPPAAEKQEPAKAEPAYASKPKGGRS